MRVKAVAEEKKFNLFGTLAITSARTHPLFGACFPFDKFRALTAPRLETVH